MEREGESEMESLKVQMINGGSHFGKYSLALNSPVTESLRNVSASMHLTFGHYQQ